MHLAPAAIVAATLVVLAPAPVASAAVYSQAPALTRAFAMSDIGSPSGGRFADDFTLGLA
ncbi:MAG TPA: hypothetical protein VF624_01325 [Tepidisphaeraceae bacterium]|jgi:hypothetical protein